jgi:hypothetical protein
MADDTEYTNLPSLYDEPNNVVVSDKDTIKEVSVVDLDIANNTLVNICSSWKYVHSISGVCRLAAATFNAIEHRRKILRMPYGVETRTARSTVVELLD